MSSIIDKLSNSKVKVKSILSILKFVTELIENNYNPILIINIYGTITKMKDSKQELSDINYRKLCSMMQNSLPDNLIFISDIGINSCGLVETMLDSLNLFCDESIIYNLIFANGSDSDSTYYRKISDYLFRSQILKFKSKSVIIYIDHNDFRLNNFKCIIDDDQLNYVLFKYCNSSNSSKLFSYIEWIQNKDDYEILEKFSTDSITSDGIV